MLSDNDSADSDAEMTENRRQWDDGHGLGSKTRWEWRFYLLLEDAKASPTDRSNTRLRALVLDQDAVMLLKMDAEKYVPSLCDLIPSIPMLRPNVHPLTDKRAVSAKTLPRWRPSVRNSSSSGATSKSARTPRRRRSSLETPTKARVLRFPIARRR